jgi:hypothetical protein
MHITAKGNSFQMAWCLQCHRNPERYLGWSKDLHKEHPSDTPRQLAFKLYWKLQTKGKSNLSPAETILVNGNFEGADDQATKEAGREIVEKYGIKTQQLADCGVCHR